MVDCQSKIPKITVLMPIYNCDLYIKEAIDSILNQTFMDFEFIIIDDASTDNTVFIVKRYNDSRIKLIEKEKNSGYTNSLNYGLSIARGEYIARMDGDDISLPERFIKQVHILDKNPNLVLCGTLFSIIGTGKVISLPERHDEIKIALLKYCCFGHPTVMMRKSILDEFSLIYDYNKEPAEDYDLWTRLLSLGQLHNLQEVLLNYRVHNSQVSHKRKQQQIEIAVNVKLNLLKRLDYETNQQEQDLLCRIIINKEFINFEEIRQYQIIKSKLINANIKVFFEEKGFMKYLFDIENRILKNYFLRSPKYSPKVYFEYLSIKKGGQFKFQTFKEIKLFLKSIIFYTKR